jgi:hypothetical protein
VGSLLLLTNNAVRLLELQRTREQNERRSLEGFSEAGKTRSPPHPGDQIGGERSPTDKSYLLEEGPGKAVSARGASGGLATFWDSSKLELVEEFDTMHWIYTKLNHKGSDHQVSLFNLYVPVLINEKKDCWDSLQLFLNNHHTENIVVAGDLNVTLSLAEKKGGTIVRDPSREWVEDLMTEWELEDIPPSNGKFTWSNKRLGPGHIAARLDRFLIQSSFLTLGLRASTKVLPHYISDHKPLALSLRPSAALGPIPFKFSPLWLEQGDFLILVHHSWKDPVTGSPSYVWEEKIQTP